MKIKTLAAATVIAWSSLCLAGADAAILVATYTGTIADGRDVTGVFGAAGSDLAGDTYIAKYTLNTSNGTYVNNLPASDDFYGGSSDGTSSPVSATLTINGITQSIGGYYYGFATAVPTGPSTEHYARDYSDVDNVITDYFTFTIQTTVSPISIYDTLPLTNTTNSYGMFQLININTNTGLESADAYGDFGSPGTVQITGSAGVPEPATWAMMMTGLFGLGAVLRHARGKQFGAIAA
jgi:hypothetical protein